MSCERRNGATVGIIVRQAAGKTLLSQQITDMDVKSLFEKAVADSKSLPQKPSNETLLNLYSLYKQSTEGDVNSDTPSMFDFVAKAKYEAWSSLKGKPKEDAMQEYIRLIEKLSN